jgi:hypothetical protein
MFAGTTRYVIYLFCYLLFAVICSSAQTERDREPFHGRGVSRPVNFEFSQADAAGNKRRFVFQLIDSARVTEARSILRDSTSQKRHVSGVIVRGRAKYNPLWSFHLRPDSIYFFELQAEVCDANVVYVEQHLDELGGSFLPRSFWCPWSSYLEDEVE